MNGIKCDQDKCSGCLSCVVACIDQHYSEDQADAVSCRIYEKVVSERTGWMSYKTRSCLHCENAACIDACPANALYKNEQGFVIPVRENCIGCQACAAACPFDIPRFDREGKLVKCDGCYVRVAHGLKPACVQSCSTGALKTK